MMKKCEVSVRWLRIMLGAVLLASAVKAEAQNKWVWSGGGRSIYGGGSATYDPDDEVRSRYRPPAPVFEVTDFTNPPPFLQPSKPVSTLPENYSPINFPRPGSPGILTGSGSSRPGRPDILTGPLIGSGSSRPGRPDILTGPIPSWEQHPDDKFAYKDYEHCKCAYPFNCASPGIKFGQCDSGKQYCCYNPKHISNGGPPPFNRGPGFVGPSAKPTYDRPILVGPGGPTGIVSEGGRPYKPFGGPYRPLVRGDIDEDYRQNGRPYQGYGTINDEHFPRPAYDHYARNANIEEKKNGMKL